MEPKFDITYVSFLIGIFPLVIFINSFINLKITSLPNIWSIIETSINDYPLVNLTYSSVCSKNDFPHSLYNFPGSKEGCSCVNVKEYNEYQTNKEEVFPDKCNYNQTMNGCELLNKVQRLKLYNWKNGRFCSKLYNIKKINGYLYFLNDSVLENESCKEGYKKCGKLDNHDNYLCFPENEECPINDIIYSSIERPDLVDKNYTYINISNQYFYYTNQKIENPVIVKLKASTKNLCIFKINEYTEFPQYILDNNFINYGCKIKINEEFYDKNIEKLDNMTKHDLYINSFLNLDDIYNSTIYDYPFYSLQEKMYLYSKRYYGFDKKCLLENGGLDLDSFVYNNDSISNIFTISQKIIEYNNYTLFFSLFSFKLELFLTSLLIMEIDIYYLFIIIWTIFNCIFYTSMGIPIYLIFIQIKNSTLLPLCGDNALNGILSAYNRPINIFKVTTIIQIVFLNLQILYNIIIIILKVFFLFDKSENLLIKKTSKDIDFNKSDEAPYYESND